MIRGRSLQKSLRRPRFHGIGKLLLFVICKVNFLLCSGTMFPSIIILNNMEEYLCLLHLHGLPSDHFSE